MSAFTKDYRNGGVGMSPEMRAIEEKHAAPNFTPGPWAANANGLIAQDSRAGKARNVIAFVRGYDGSVEALANARLVAAAPELYEALRAFVAAYTSMPEGRESRELEACNAAQTLLLKVNA